MIKGLYGGSHVVIEGGLASSTPMLSNGNPTSMAGMVRYNTSGNFEVYDGYNWNTLQTMWPTIGLSHTANNAIDWVQNRIVEEEEWKRADHPAVKAAWENFHKARQQLEVTAILAKQEEENNGKTTN
jgi:hypothetical protein